MKIGVLVVAAAALQQGSGVAEGLERTMRAWCSQAGEWRGEIEIIDAKGTAQVVTINSRHSCTPDGKFHVAEEDFVAPQRTDHTLKVTYIDAAVSGFRTAYFANGKETTYSFGFASIEFERDDRWVQSIQSPGDGELFEGRKAILRYTRERDGDRLVSRKEVQFVDGSSGFEVRSIITQRRVRPQLREPTSTK
jgi:hypothetical protein